MQGWLQEYSHSASCYFSGRCLFFPSSILLLLLFCDCGAHAQTAGATQPQLGACCSVLSKLLLLPCFCRFAWHRWCTHTNQHTTHCCLLLPPLRLVMGREVRISGCIFNQFSALFVFGCWRVCVCACVWCVCVCVCVWVWRARPSPSLSSPHLGLSWVDARAVVEAGNGRVELPTRYGPHAILHQQQPAAAEAAAEERLKVKRNRPHERVASQQQEKQKGPNEGCSTWSVESNTLLMPVMT